MSDTSVEAEALRIAERMLLRLNWRHGPKKIGETAREILDGLNHKSASDPTEASRPTSEGEA